MRLTVTNYLDVISSWCFWAIPAWRELRERFGDGVDFRWKIALMDEVAMPKSRAQIEWYYRRSGMLMRSPFMLQTAWFEEGRGEYLPPNCVAEAARSLGVEDDRVWIALANAELREGKKIANWEVAAEVGAAAAELDSAQLFVRAKSRQIEEQVRQTTVEFHALQITQRPAFVIDSPIGDRAVFSGFAKAGPIAATLEAMLEDIAGYAAHAAHFGPRVSRLLLPPLRMKFDPPMEYDRLPKRARTLQFPKWGIETYLRLILTFGIFCKTPLRLSRCGIQLPLGSGHARTSRRASRMRADSECAALLSWAGGSGRAP